MLICVIVTMAILVNNVVLILMTVILNHASMEELVWLVTIYR